MPIYDNDGTANYQIGKLYDSDGTNKYQIGKVYDNDGTTNSLIYSAEVNALADMTFTWAGTGGAQVTQTVSQLVVSSLAPNGETDTYAIAYVWVDYSEYSKVTITYSYTAQYAMYIGFGFSSNATAIEKTNIAATFDTGVYTNVLSGSNTSASNKSVTLTLPSSGGGYLKIAQWQVVGPMTTTITKILFE